MNSKYYPQIHKALLHINQFYPEVNTVAFGIDTRWRYAGDDINDAVSFGENELVDVSILEDAQAEAGNTVGFPCVFFLDKSPLNNMTFFYVKMESPKGIEKEFSMFAVNESDVRNLVRVEYPKYRIISIDS